MGLLDERDYVQNVYFNFVLSEALMKKMDG